MALPSHPRQSEGEVPQVYLLAPSSMRLSRLDWRNGDRWKPNVGIDHGVSNAIKFNCAASDVDG